MKPASAAERLARLHALLGGPALAGLRQRLRRALERAPTHAPPATLRLGDLAAHEAEALQALTGQPPRSSRAVQLNLGALAAQLQAAGLAADLREALEQLDGPLSTERTDQAVAAAAWLALAQAGAPHPALAALLAQPHGLGLLKRLASGEAGRAVALRDAAARVLTALPAGGIPRSRLAALHLGNAHALDEGQPVATLVLASLRVAADGSSTLENQREAWAGQGVSVNELARPALLLNVPTAELPAALPAAGEPYYLSLRLLLRAPPAWRVAGRAVFVCENPNLLSLAADALGPACAALVCTEGMPAAAQRTLLLQLAAAGARLHYHGDFDWAGVAIANRVLQDYGASPWRMASTDYLAAVEQAGADAAAPLAGRAVATTWDPRLESAMTNMGRAVAEEAVFETLLPDLAA